MEKVLVKNRKATFDYQILQKFEAGIVLFGHEVKSLKNGGGQMQGCFVTARNGELYIEHLHIAPYIKSTLDVYEPERPRKLLVSKAEIQKIAGALKQNGVTLVALSCIAKNGLIKIEFAVGKGMKKYDKRENLKKKDEKRQIQRQVRY